jgi:saccharopine dehydrogenase-like NADP-dependent oxidoreductase
MAAASFTAAVLGGTGNVGTLIVQNLLKNERVGKVTLFTRRHLPEYEGNAKIKYNHDYVGDVI